MSRFDGSRGPPRIEGMTSLKVDNLTYRTTIEELDRYFTKFGDVGDIYIPRDRHRRESRGFAFVRYYERRDAEDAMDAMDGAVIDGREIRVQLAKYGRPSEQYVPPRDRGRSRYGGGRYGGRDRSPGRRRRRSRSRSHSRRRSRSRSRSGSPRRYTRKYSRSPRKYSRSRSPRRSRSASGSPRRSRSDSRSRSPVRSRSPTKSRSRSRSAGSPKRSRSGSHPRSKSPPVIEEREENHSMEGEDEE